MEMQGLGFIDAVKDLAQQVGLQVPEDARSPQERARDTQMRTRQLSLTQVLEQAAQAYRDQLRQSERAVQYFKDRGLSGHIAQRYGLGYAPDSSKFLAGVFPDYTSSLLVDSGLVIERSGGENERFAEARRYDRFRDRVMFPIRNVKGETIGFGARVLGKGEPKYLNSPETPVFSKGRELYGLFEARESLQQAGYVLVTEGYMDVVALAQLGFPQTVATLGTACTTEHVQKLFRFTNSVVFSFDGDTAGRRAARKALDTAIPFATDTRTVRFVFLPAEHDPDSYIRDNGPEAFSRMVSSAKPLSVFLVDSAREGLDMDSVEGRAHLAANAKPMWLALPEGAIKKQLLRELAGLIGIDERELSDLWKPTASFSAAKTPFVPSGRVAAGPAKSSDPRTRPMHGYGPNQRVRLGQASGSGATRRLPPSRLDRAIQIVSLQSGLWETLSASDQHLLCSLPGSHGAAFIWLDAQTQEYGPQPWAALSVALQGHALEGFVRKLVESVPLDIDNDCAEFERILASLRAQAFNEQKEKLLERAATDPAAYEEYKRLIQTTPPP